MTVWVIQYGTHLYVHRTKGEAYKHAAAIARANAHDFGKSDFIRVIRERFTAADYAGAIDAYHAAWNAGDNEGLIPELDVIEKPLLP